MGYSYSYNKTNDMH